MKIVYCMHSLYNPGGMERTMLNKIAYWKAHTDWDVVAVTTNQQGRPLFFPLPDGVKHVDLGINYVKEMDDRPLQKVISYLKKRRRHRKLLTELLMKERADVTVSLFPSESSFIPSIADGSKKVLELHLNRYFRLQYNRTGIVGLIDRFRSWQDVRLVRRFDRFVVLTEEDRGYWGTLSNIAVIPNSSVSRLHESADLTSHHLIAVGRLDYQKSFDRLLMAWAEVCATPSVGDWVLDIFGQGEWEERLRQMIAQLGIGQHTVLHGPSTDIEREYLNSSAILMTSHYEGLPMVLIEAMSHGLPPVAFACKCGPRDLIDDGKNGLLVEDGNIHQFAQAVVTLITDETLRRRMSQEALKIKERYSEESVMKQWKDLFCELQDEKTTAN